MLEQDPSIFPKISITHVEVWIASHLSFLPSVPLASHGDHLPTTGAEAMLSEHLDDLEPKFNTSGR